MQVKALIFDVFGTIVDWRSGVATYCNKVFETKDISYDPNNFADLWREQYKPAMEKIRSGNRGYVALDILHRENLEIVLEQTNLSGCFDKNERDNLNLAWEHLPTWPDTVSGLSKLKKQFTIAPCSNGSISLMTNLALFSNLPWDDYVGAETAQNYKPELIVYKKSVEKLGLLPQQVVMVAAHNEDLIAAKKAGLKTAFFPRPAEHGSNQKTDLTASFDWDYIASDLNDLASKLCS